MNLRPSTLVLWIAVLLGFFATPDRCDAQQFRSGSYGYQLTLPPGWIEIPSSILEEQRIAVYAEGSSIIWDAAFQLESAGNWFEYPYVIVQPVPYAAHGMKGQPKEDELPRFVRALSGLDLVGVADSQLSSEARPRFGTVETGLAELDAAKRRYQWTGHADVQGIGPIRFLAVGYFGHQSIVQLLFYSRSGDWDRHSDMRRSLLDSFRFDTDRAYRSPPP